MLGRRRSIVWPCGVHAGYDFVRDCANFGVIDRSESHTGFWRGNDDGAERGFDR